MSGTPMWRRYARIHGADPGADVDDELRFHIQSKIDELINQGMAREAAESAAHQQFGNLAQIRETGEKLNREREDHVERKQFWSAFVQDLVFALRTLRKVPSFTAVVITILGIGIATNTAVFSLVNTVLLRPLPFSHPEQLVWLSGGRDYSKKIREAAGLSGTTYQVVAYEEIASRSKTFQGLTAYDPFFGDAELNLTGIGEPQAVAGVRVAQNFFPLLGVKPMMGRTFAPDECVKNARPTAILSYAFWQRQFGGDPGILGRRVLLNKAPFTVIGVMPQSFDFGSIFSPGTQIDLYVPAVMDDMRTWGNTLAIVGRVKPDVSLAQAQAELDVVVPAMMAAKRVEWGDYSTTVSPLKDFVSGKLRRSLIVLWCSVGAILLIVCVNLSTLLLARTTSRSKEFALRTALGATKGRVLRQLLTESFVLSCGGAALGLLLAVGLIRYLAHQDALGLPLLNLVSLDTTALAWTLLLSMGAALVFGLTTGLKAAGSHIADSLKDSGAGMSAGRFHERTRSGLVIAEVALSCVLLVSAGLLLRSFLRVMDVDLGFRPASASSIKIDLPGDKAPAQGALAQRMFTQVQAIPGVQAAGITDMLPLGRNRSWAFSAQGVSYAKDEALAAVVRVVSPGYLQAMGMRFVAGGDFTWQQMTTKEPVIIVNQAAARRFWQGGDPMKQKAMLDGRAAQVNGIVADVRIHSLEEAAGPEMYVLLGQSTPEGAELVVRSSVSPQSLAPSVMAALRSVNPNQPGTDLRPLQQIVDRSVSPRRFFAVLVGGFALLGLILASLGIYGVIAYSVTRRTQEIGIRLALGASVTDVHRSVLGSALRLTAIGLAIGGCASFGVAGSLATLLYGTEPTDPFVFGGVILLLCAVACCAGLIPAQRAARIDPMQALRTA